MTIYDINFLSIINILTLSGGFAAAIITLSKFISIYFVTRSYNKTIFNVASMFRNDLNKQEIVDLYK